MEKYLRTHPVEQVYDDLLVAALSHAKWDRDSLTKDDEQFILHATREIVEDLGSRQPGIPASAVASKAQVDENVAALPKLRILECAARDQADELALLMLRQLLDSLQCEFELISAEMLASEVVSVVEEKSPAVVCIGGVPPADWPGPATSASGFGSGSPISRLSSDAGGSKGPSVRTGMSCSQRGQITSGRACSRAGTR